MTEHELERLQQAVDRLREAQEEAAYTCQEALTSSAALETTAIDSAEDEAQSYEVITHLTGALEDVLAIVEALPRMMCEASWRVVSWGKEG